jgi:hypothetical protein
MGNKVVVNRLDDAGIGADGSGRGASASKKDRGRFVTA